MALLVVGLGTTGLVILAPGANNGGQPQYLTATVSRANVTQRVVATGSLRSAAIFDLAFGADPTLTTDTGAAGGGGSGVSWLVASVTVAVGATVTKDEVLATADTVNAKAALDVATANLAVAKARLAVDSAGLTGARRSAAYDSIRQAQQQLKVAMQSQVQTAAQNALKLSQAQAALATAQKKLADDLAAGLPAATVTADQAAIDQAQQQLDSLQLSIAASNGSAANQVASARLSLSSSQNNYSIQVAPADPSTIATDEASVATAQSGVTAAQYTFDRSRLTSPVDGVVTAVNIATGATAPAGAAVTVASREMEVSATVTESDYPSLKLGQAVDVAIVALGQTVTGTVKQIVPTGTVSNGVVTYPIIVTLDSTSGGAASGMSADIQVTTAQASNVLAVPARALNGTNGSYSVRVLGSNGAVTAQTVQVGLITSSLAEITGGLTEGQTVVTGISTPQTGNATTTNGGLGGGFEGGGVDLPGGGGGGGGGGHAPGAGGGG
ncbi:MAG: HlyD family efflux transporter periplasmic adaptor subunit [Chloroflexi bacterium]|nr:HlyD family efflux transporter periplasmic adaptor subunit [Chloroflexota bacterium]